MEVMITGARGMLGSALVKHLKQQHYILAPSRKELDLENRNDVRTYILKYRPDVIFHLAAKVGGIASNSLYPADFYTQNIKINTNVLEAALELALSWRENLKVISIMSTCVYPDNATYPLTEDQMHNGPPHFSNFAYAYTKRMLDVQSSAYRKQHNVNFITAIPNNIYGIGDIYGYGAHVIPSLMSRIHEAKIENKQEVIVWGNGSELREFTFAPDIAKNLYTISKYAKNIGLKGPVNIGNTKEVSIKELTETLIDIIEYKGKIKWDITKPTGQFRKPSSTLKFEKLFGVSNYIPLKEGLKITYEWFKNTYPNVRFMKK